MTLLALANLRAEYERLRVENALLRLGIGRARSDLMRIQGALEIALEGLDITERILTEQNE